MANIFKQQKEVNNNPKRNNFDLSFQNHLTMKMGTLYPVFCKEVVPGDSFRIHSAFGLKFMPLAFPVQSKMRASMQFFYVRNKNLWKDWENWVSGLKGHADGVDHPYISQNADFFKTGKLADYLNVPTTYATAGDVDFVVDGLFLDNINYYGGLVHGGSLEDGVANSVYWFSNQWYSGSTLIGRENTNYPLNNRMFYIGDTDATLFSHYYSSNRTSTFGVAFGFTNNPLTGSYFNYRIVTNVGLPVLALDYVLKIMYRSPNDEQTSHWRIGYATNYNGYVTNETAITVPSAFKNAWNGLIGQGYEVALILEFTRNDFKDYFNGTNPFITSFYFDKSLNYITSAASIADDSFSTPFSSSADAIRLNALPFRAYESIVRCYFKNPTIQPLLIGGSPEYNRYNTTLDGGADTTPYQLEKRNYELDFLTSALPSPQQGNAPLVGFNAITGTITIEDESGITTAKADIDNNGTIVGLQVTSPIAGKEHAITAAQLATCGMSINSFRDTNALQRWLETNIRKGYRYLDFIAGHFGKSPEYRELDMPEFIGGFSRDVTVSQVISTADTLNGDTGANLGTFGGTANCFGGSNHSISHYCDDFGFIIGILCVTPTPSYSQLLPKHYLKYNPLDYYFPEFAQLGMQPITYEEVCPVQAYNESLAAGATRSVTDTFGYQRPNYDLVSNVDEIHGQFRATLHNFLINRVFGTSPVLGNDFLQIDPDETNQIFVDNAPDNDNIIGQVIFDVKAKRPVPRVVIPSLGR